MKFNDNLHKHLCMKGSIILRKLVSYKKVIADKVTHVDFEKKIKNPKLSIIMDTPYQKRPLLIAFGGMAGAMGIPPFEFFKLTNQFDINKIFIRDLGCTWYHSGFPGISNNIDGSALFLRRKIDELNVTKIIVVGCSMGGYAAILFGLLLKADVVHAFSPQTFLYDIKSIRSKKQLQIVHNNFTDKYFDLKKVFQLDDNKSAIYNIYYDTTNEIDKKHATHLQKTHKIKLHTFMTGGHGLIKNLKKSGKLKQLIQLSLDDITPGQTPEIIK